MKIPKDIQDKIAKILEREGFEVLSFGSPNSGGYYRPRIEGKNSPISIKIFNDNIYINDFSGNLPNGRMVLDYQCKQVRGEAGKKTNNDSKGFYKEALAERKKESIKRMVEVFEGIVRLDASTHSLFKEKKITKNNDSEAFTVNELEITPKWTVKDALIVPFKCASTDEFIGAQFRLNDDLSKKYSVTGSTFKNAYHEIQKGEPILGVNRTPLFISESFTTGSTIAECFPKAKVVCTAGMGNVLETIKSLEKRDFSYLPIIVLDKTKQNKSNELLTRLESAISTQNIAYIQPSKTDRRFLDMTDFNDIRLKHGLKATKLCADVQAREYIPIKPEVLGFERGDLQVVSPVNQRIISLRGLNYLQGFNREISYAWTKEFLKMHRGFREIQKDHEEEDETSSKQKIIENALLTRFINEEIAKQKVGSIKGVGIFEESGGFVANLQGGRFVLKDSLDYSLDLKPFGKNIYLKMPSTGESLDLENVEFKKKTLSDFRKIWDSFYKQDSSYALALLGYVAQAAYAAFSPHRAHMWLMGKTGVGKSFIIKTLIKHLARGFVHRTQDVSAAGIKQLLSPEDGTQNCPLITIDEAADDTVDKAKRISDVIKLSREMATSDEDTISLRGTKEQEAKIYNNLGSVLLASRTHSLTDPQDISRFLFMRFIEDINRDGDININDVNGLMEKLSLPILKGIILGAPHFKRLFLIIQERLLKEYKELDKLSHKLSALCSVLAGVACLFRVVNKTDAKAVSFIMENSKVFINDQIQHHEQSLKNTVDIIEDLKTARIKTNMGEYWLKDFLADDQDQNEVFCKAYGIYYSQRLNSLRVNITRYRLNRLTQSSQMVDRFHCSKNALIEAAENNNEAKLVYRSRCPMTSKQYSWVNIEVNSE